jgi:hypothetical protein
MLFLLSRAVCSIVRSSAMHARAAEPLPGRFYLSRLGIETASTSRGAQVALVRQWRLSDEASFMRALSGGGFKAIVRTTAVPRLDLEPPSMGPVERAAY